MRRPSWFWAHDTSSASVLCGPPLGGWTAGGPRAEIAWRARRLRAFMGEVMAKISVNKLGEYMVARSPARRRRIILDQHQPATFITSRYSAARKAIADFLIDQDHPKLAAAAVQLRDERGGTDHAHETRQLCADAINSFIDMAPALAIDGVTYSAAPQRPHKLVMAEVEVSVAPDVMLVGTVRRRNLGGALKLYFAKGNDKLLLEDGSRYVATAIHEWLAGHPHGGHAPHAAYCLSVDVFRGRVTAAPTARIRRLDDLRAACEEIAAGWPQQ